MSLALIVPAMRTRVAAMSGVGACYPKIPDSKPDEALFAIIETPSGTITQHGVDIENRTHTINVYFAVKRAGALWDEQEAVLPYVDSFPTAMASAITLSGLTYGTRYADPAWELTEFSILDQNYLALKYATLHKEKVTLTYSG